jgi:hypothetical protein
MLHVLVVVRKRFPPPLSGPQPPTSSIVTSGYVMVVLGQPRVPAVSLVCMNVKSLTPLSDLSPTSGLDCRWFNAGRLRHFTQEIHKWDADLLRYYYSKGIHCRVIATVGQQRSHFFTADEAANKAANHPYRDYEDYLDFYCKLASITSIS